LPKDWQPHLKFQLIHAKKSTIIFYLVVGDVEMTQKMQACHRVNRLSYLEIVLFLVKQNQIQQNLKKKYNNTKS
jgi:hypothetical protein